MSRWLLLLTISLLSVIAHAQPGQKSTSATDVAASATTSVERLVAQLTVRSAALEKRYTEELDAIDRLKRQRPSWRRDREIESSLSVSLETAKQLDRATTDLKRARGKLDTARRVYLSAIGAELGAGVSSARAHELARAKALLVWQLKDASAPRHVAMPDLEVDPLADPEELDQRAAELRETEQQMNKQLVVLEAQISELQRTAQLRKHNDRAVDLASRYEDSPHHRVARGGEAGADVVDNTPPSRLPTAPDGRLGTIESASPATDVIDTSTDPLAGARSASPAQRAEAARKTYDSLLKRLDQVRTRRMEIEARARELRSKR
jgi:hypothetical protein